MTRRRLSARAVLLTSVLFLAGCAREPAGFVPVFCYDTLADIACYLEPDPGREARLVGIGRHPVDAELLLLMRAAGPR